MVVGMNDHQHHGEAAPNTETPATAHRHPEAVDHASMGHDHGAMKHAPAAGGGHSGHSNHSGADHVSQFRKLFWTMLIIAIPVVGLNPMFAMLLGYELPDAAWL